MENVRVIISIVERGQGAALERLLQKNHISYHASCIGRGTATSEIMDILGLDSNEKDIVFSYAIQRVADHVMKMIDDGMPGSTELCGIACSLPISGINNVVAALLAYQGEQAVSDIKGEHTMERTENSMIIVFCKRGCSGDVMATAKSLGARGGTVIRSRLSGLEELEQAYDIEFTEEREIIAIVVPTELRAPIMEDINKKHGLRSGAQAIVCSLPIEAMVRF